MLEFSGLSETKTDRKAGQKPGKRGIGMTANHSRQTQSYSAKKMTGPLSQLFCFIFAAPRHE
jgi:hypothetical protein